MVERESLGQRLDQHFFIASDRFLQHRLLTIERSSAKVGNRSKQHASKYHEQRTTSFLPLGIAEGCSNEAASGHEPPRPRREAFRRPRLMRLGPAATLPMHVFVEANHRRSNPTPAECPQLGVSSH